MKVPESLKNLLSEEELKEIKSEFDKQVQIQVESTLHQYDEEAIKKINKVIALQEAASCNKVAKYISDYKENIKNRVQSLKEHYEAQLTSESESFKNKLVNAIENHINNKIESILPYATIKESAKNNTAYKLLKSLRHQLGVNTALMQESIKAPFIDAKKKMDKACKMINELKLENKQLSEQVEQQDSKLLIESKIAKLPVEAADHMRCMLQGKPIIFIKENFSYILDLYNKGLEAKRSVLRENAIQRHLTNKNKVTEPKSQKNFIKESFSSEKKLVNKSEKDLFIESILNDDEM